MLEQLDFPLTRDGLVCVNLRAGLHLFASQIHRHAGFPRCRLADDMRREQHFAAGQPAPGVHHQVTDSPKLIVEEEIVNLADLAIPRGDRVTSE